MFKICHTNNTWWSFRELEIHGNNKICTTIWKHSQRSWWYIEREICVGIHLRFIVRFLYSPISKWPTSKIFRIILSCTSHQFSLNSSTSFCCKQRSCQQWKHTSKSLILKSNHIQCLNCNLFDVLQYAIKNPSDKNRFSSQKILNELKFDAKNTDRVSDPAAFHSKK